MANKYTMLFKIKCTFYKASTSRIRKELSPIVLYVAYIYRKYKGTKSTKAR